MPTLYLRRTSLQRASTRQLATTLPHLRRYADEHARSISARPSGFQRSFGRRDVWPRQSATDDLRSAPIRRTSPSVVMPHLRSRPMLPRFDGASGLYFPIGRA